jgi:DNA invertase Pin-like site-specific DNA recombinase
MATAMKAENTDVLLGWRDAEPARRRRGRPVGEPVGALRFAFYGRLSTKEHQDSDTSRRWQLECAQDVIARAGQIVAEFFDVGFSRRRPWPSRPEASKLLAAVTGHHCLFDAVVIGEYERAFCGRQVFPIATLLREHQVQLWLPETLGPVDLDDPAHRAVLIEVGARATREVQRDRHRATEAMRVQARDQGRYLGGRPPYGYRLVDAGPHPTPSHARWGRRQQQLDPDPVTAPHVRESSLGASKEPAWP